MLISAVSSAIVAIIGAIFAGFIALRQLPQMRDRAQLVSAKVSQVQSTVNGNLERERARNDALIAELKAVYALLPPSILSDVGAAASAGAAAATDTPAQAP